MAQFAHNKKAKFDYELQDEYEAGIDLVGHEVKSIKAGKADLTGAFVVVRGGEAFLVGANIPPFQPNNTPDNYDPERPRRLLLSKKELAKLTDIDNQKGLTLVVNSLYNKGRNIKLSFHIARGKKKFDKRESIKERESKRDIERTLKNRR